MERADVVIAGGGFAGLALGIALRQGLGPAFAIVVADPFLGRAGIDLSQHRSPPSALRKPKNVPRRVGVREQNAFPWSGSPGVS